MATRCLIGAPLLDSGLPTTFATRRAIGYVACHNGGLVDAGVMLARHYRTPNSVAALLNAGDLLSLGPTPEASRYAADRPLDAPYATARDEDAFAALWRCPIEMVYLATAREGRVFWFLAQGAVQTAVPTALRDLGVLNAREIERMFR